MSRRIKFENTFVQLESAIMQNQETEEKEEKDRYPSEDGMHQDEIHKAAENLIYDIWFTVAEKIFNKVCDITELDAEQREALKTTCLRPNDFHIIIK